MIPDYLVTTDVPNINEFYLRYIPNAVLVLRDKSDRYDMSVTGNTVTLYYKPRYSREQLQRLFATAAYVMRGNRSPVEDVTKTVVPAQIPSLLRWAIATNQNQYSIVPLWLMQRKENMYEYLNLLISPAVLGRDFAALSSVSAIVQHLYDAFSISAHRIDLCIGHKSYRIYVHAPRETYYSNYVNDIMRDGYPVLYKQYGGDAPICFSQVLAAVGDRLVLYYIRDKTIIYERPVS